MLNLSPELAQYTFWSKLKNLPFVEGIYLFGSRARGDAGVTSDIDIAIDCVQGSNWQQVLDVIEEADTLLMVDVVRYDALKEGSLFKHNIDKDRWVVYKTLESMVFYSSALKRFEEALDEDLSNPLAIDGSIQRFEFSFELAWKLLKKILMDLEGIEALLSPKKILQFSFKLGWIKSESAWLLMLSDRNLTSYTYREECAQEIYSHLVSHLKNMQALQNHIKILLKDEH